MERAWTEEQASTLAPMTFLLTTPHWPAPRPFPLPGPPPLASTPHRPAHSCLVFLNLLLLRCPGVVIKWYPREEEGPGSMGGHGRLGPASKDRPSAERWAQKHRPKKRERGNPGSGRISPSPEVTQPGGGRVRIQT